MFRTKVLATAAAAAEVALLDAAPSRTRAQLLPRGPLTTYGVSTGGLRVKSGLNLRDVAEPRCGIFTTVAEERVRHQALNSTSAANGGDAVAEAPLPRLPAWVKGEPGDWQRSTVTDLGEVKQIGKRPKPRWSKIAPKKTVPIEVDPTSSESPTKLFYPYTVHHGLYARRRGRVPVGAPVLNFSCYSQCWHHKSILTRMLRGGHTEETLQFNEVAADGFGANCVSGILVGGTKEGLPHCSELHNLNPLIFNPESNVDLSPEAFAAPNKSRGTYNRIMLRGVVGTQEQVVERLQRLMEDGFLNYFSVGSFGAGSNAAHDIGASLFGSSSNSDVGGVGGKLAAMGMWLQSEAQCNPVLHDYYKSYVSAPDRTTADGMLQLVEKKLRKDNPLTTDFHLLSFLEHLNKHNSHAASALRNQEERGKCSSDMVSPSLESHMVLDELWQNCLLSEFKTYHVAMSRFIWNAVASQRAMTFGVDRVVVGDLVFIPARAGSRSLQEDIDVEGSVNPLQGFASASKLGEVRRIESEDDAKEFSIFDVVLPLPCTRGGGAAAAAISPLFPAHAASDEALYKDISRSSNMDAVWSTDLEQAGDGDESRPASDDKMRRKDFGYRLCAKETPGVVLDAKSQMPYRRFLAKPESLSFKMEYDPNSQSLLKTDLFLVQERKPLTTDLEGTRFRTPSPVNQSEVLRDTLSAMVQLSQELAKDSQVKAGTAIKTLPKGPNSTIGPHSLGLSFLLPSGTHPQCLLRECFDAKQINYDDLLRPSLLSS